MCDIPCRPDPIAAVLQKVQHTSPVWVESIVLQVYKCMHMCVLVTIRSPAYLMCFRCQQNRELIYLHNNADCTVSIHNTASTQHVAHHMRLELRRQIKFFMPMVMAYARSRC